MARRGKNKAMMDVQGACGQGEEIAGNRGVAAEKCGSGGGRPARARLFAPAVAAALVLGALAGCTAVKEMTQSPDAASSERPQRLAAEGAPDNFPNLATVPDAPRPYTAPEDRERVVAQMTEDRAQATFTSTDTTSAAAGTEPAPLITAAGPLPAGVSTIISSDSVTTSDQVTGLPAATTAGGQLAAIIFFSHGSSALDARDRSVLQDLARLHAQRGGQLRIVGHASSYTQNTTPDEHQLANFETSLERANVVMDYLAGLGVAADAMQAEAVGDAQPVYHEFMPSGEAGNRRVEIFLEN